MTEQALLQANDTAIIAFLEQLNSDEINNYRHALVLLWQVHSEPHIKERAQQLLEQQLAIEEMQTIVKTFSIFDSIISYLPWAGDYKNLQQQNYYAFESGKEPYETLLIDSPILVEQYLDLGRRLYKMFDLLPEAKSCFESILTRNPKQAEALYALGRLVEQEGDYDLALLYYEQCIEQDQAHVYAHLQAGILQMEQEEAYEKAIEHYQVVLEIEPFMTETHVQMAKAHRGLGDLSRAKQFIDIALDINSYQEDALNLQGWIQWKDEQKVEAALATFEQGADHPIHGDSGLLLASLGRLHQEQMGDMDKARIYYEKSLAANLKQQETLQHLMQLLEEHYQDYGAMAQYYERYLEQVPKDPTIRTNYASFLIKYLNDYYTAKEQIEKALALDEDFPPAVTLSLQISQHFGEDSTPKQVVVVEDEDDDDDDDDDFVGGGAAGDN
jgi:tetratricopeptide (TPR) repeat protein